MPLELTDREARVIGCLMEKSVITPDQYPLTLNALANACNQKSSRDPVMNLEPGEVLATIRALQDKHLVRSEENFRTQVEKFTHRLCNTPFSDYEFDPAQFAIITVLLLRGPRTPGELKANVGRLHTFADNAEVQATLETLRNREGGPVVAELPRTPGRRDSEYMHLLSGPVENAVQGQGASSDRGASTQSSSVPAVSAPRESEASTLEARLTALEAEVASLKQELAALRGDNDAG
ncbi:MAG: DUF480 domain-containing protein [Pseudomonadota bacterium]